MKILINSDTTFFTNVKLFISKNKNTEYKFIIPFEDYNKVIEVFNKFSSINRIKFFTDIGRQIGKIESDNTAISIEENNNMFNLIISMILNKN